MRQLSPEELAAQLIASASMITPARLQPAIERAAELCATHLKRKSPVDTGHYKNAWQRQGLQTVNLAPHAGIIERGARPHKVSKEGQEAIAAWVRRVIKPSGSSGGSTKQRRTRFATQVKRTFRKLLKFLSGAFSNPSPVEKKTSPQREVSEKAVQSITWAICKKLERDGQKAKYVVRGQLDQLASISGKEVVKQITQYLQSDMSKMNKS